MKCWKHLHADMYFNRSLKNECTFRNPKMAKRIFCLQWQKLLQVTGVTKIQDFAQCLRFMIRKFFSNQTVLWLCDSVIWRETVGEHLFSRSVCVCMCVCARIWLQHLALIPSEFAGFLFQYTCDLWRFVRRSKSKRRHSRDCHFQFDLSWLKPEFLNQL